VRGAGLGETGSYSGVRASRSANKLWAVCKVYLMWKTWALGLQDYFGYPREVRNCGLETSNVSTKLFRKPNMFTEDAANLLAAIVVSSDEVIISKDLNGIITTWNEGARRVFGYSAEGRTGRPVSAASALEAKLRHHKPFDERINHTVHMVGRHKIVQYRGK
jgi:PAS domain-containing protein